jgi:hypothetical protein
MRWIAFAALALLGGCALVGGEDRTATARPLEASAPAPTPVAFKPAFGVGGPTALAPCRGAAPLAAACRSANGRHQQRISLPLEDGAPQGPTPVSSSD